MAAKNVLGIIFSNAYDEALPEITALRTMGSVPFGARYRLIDFPLSNMVNSGITTVGIITKSNYHSLMDHVGTGKPWDLSRKRDGMTILPPFNMPDTGMFSGKADALYGSIGFVDGSKKDYILVCDCNVICSIDYDDLLKAHIAKNADITLVYRHGVPPRLDSATALTFDSDGRLTGTEYIADYERERDYSLSMLIMRRGLMERLLHEAHNDGINDFKTIIQNRIEKLYVYGYEFKGFARTVDSLQSYYDISMELLKKENRAELFNKDFPIYTKVRDEVPSLYGVTAKTKNSLIADGCVIDGEVENCILFRDVRISKGAKVKNSIIMQDSYIGEDCEVDCVIMDKRTALKPGKRLCGAEDFPVYVSKGKII